MLFLFNMLMQDVPDGVVDAVTRISPYDGAAYGGLVLVLLIVLYLQYKDKQKQAEALEKAVETLNDIEISLRAIPELKLLILSKLLNTNPPNTNDA